MEGWEGLGIWVIGCGVVGLGNVRKERKYKVVFRGWVRKLIKKRVVIG